MDQQKSSLQSKKESLKQPVICPWIATQPYPSSLSNKNRNCVQKRNHDVQTNSCLNNYWNNNSPHMNSSKNSEKSTFSSMQQSSNQFFHFLRLMQLFPNTHPATLHTVLYLCKNDFFCAVDKLLYAKRCKILYNNRRNQMQQQKISAKCSSLATNNSSSSTCSSRKRLFSNCQINAEIAGKETKILKTCGNGDANSDNGSIVDENKTFKMNSTRDSEKRISKDTNSALEPFGTIKLITIKPVNIQGTKVTHNFKNIPELKNIEMKREEELS